jgi:hypothetical protein
MRTLARFLLLPVLCTALCQSQTIPSAQAQKIRTVFIESEAVDAVHLALSSTRFHWSEDRQTADLILKFDREVAKTDRTVQGNQISIGIHWTYTLVASLPDGTIVYRDSAPETGAHRTDQSEDAWVKYLRETPEYGLTKKLASQIVLR